MVAAAGEKLVEVAERLAGMGIADGAEITRAAAQSAEDADALKHSRGDL